MSNTKVLVFAGVLVLGAIAALMVASSNTNSSVTLNQTTIKRDMFGQWKVAHGKAYASSEEEEKRFKIWSSNYDWVQQHNMISENTYTVGMTIFADMTNEEFKAQQEGCLLQNRTKTSGPTSSKVSANPTSVDWRTAGAVTPVKNQGQCGSCWAFSSTGSLEGLNFIVTKNLISFSEQQLVDCATGSPYDNEGCNGGLMDTALQYTADFGIEPESVYPYTAKDGKCKYSASAVAFQNTGVVVITENDNDALETAVAGQPVSVSIEADSLVFQFYSSGVINSKSCGTNLDHGVLAVGYGATTTGQAYWIVKNSWGKSWGESGYVRIAKQSGTGPGICGIAIDNAYPTYSKSQTQRKSPKKHESGEN
jgi:C1A family cysteine protease